MKTTPFRVSRSSVLALVMGAVVVASPGGVGRALQKCHEGTGSATLSPALGDIEAADRCKATGS